MLGCVVVVLVLLVLGLAALLVPMGTALSLGQGVVVVTLLGAAARTAWAAWREEGSLALGLRRGDEEWWFPALVEDGDGSITLQLALGQEPRLAMAPADDEAERGAAPPHPHPHPHPHDHDHDHDVEVEHEHEHEHEHDHEHEHEHEPEHGQEGRLELGRRGRRRIELTVRARGEVLWRGERRVGRSVELPPEVVEGLGGAGLGPVTLTLLDR